MHTTLVIMAAGMGSRYGGDKQVDGVGPGGEILMEYGIYDAVRAGFDKIVFIIKPELRELMEKLCGKTLRGLRTAEGKPVEVAYACQTFDGLPAWYTVDPRRQKPFGTCQAVLCTREVVHEPFCVINADDYYGADAFRVIRRALVHLRSGRAAMVGYLLRNTVSAHGTVARGVCRVEEGMLRDIRENHKIRLFPDGTIANTEEDVRAELPGDTVVSMNFWGFTPEIFPELERYFHDFLRDAATDPVKGECLLPALVGKLVAEGKLAVEVLRSADRWFGMTYRQDKEAVRQELLRLHENGTYPPTLHGALA